MNVRKSTSQAVSAEKFRCQCPFKKQKKFLIVYTYTPLANTAWLFTIVICMQGPQKLQSQNDRGSLVPIKQDITFKSLFLPQQQTFNSTVKMGFPQGAMLGEFLSVAFMF